MASKKFKPVHGVDISYCQTGISYEKLKNDGVSFAIIRAGYTGTSSHRQHTDNMLTKHVNGCIKQEIPYGFYWYSGARSVIEAKREAKYCASLIKKFDRPDYPVFLDVEEPLIAEGGADIATDVCLAFVSEMNALGYPAGIYTNPDWLEHRLEKKRLLGKVDIWLAHWVDQCGCAYGQSMWQSGLRYSAGKQIDYDICFIDYPKKTAEWYSKYGGKIKTVEEAAREVIAGKWGNGAARRSKLTAAGYNYAEVQKKVNELLSAKSSGK